MKKPLPILRSRYRATYAAIIFIFVILVIGCFSVSRLVIAPLLIKNELNAIQSIINSHDKDIILDDTRALRDELIKNKTMNSDLDFDHFLPGNRDGQERERIFLASCKIATDRICVSSSGALIFGAQKKFLIFIKGDFQKIPFSLGAWETIFAFLITVTFGSLLYLIRREEKFFTQKLQHSTRYIQKISEHFSSTSQSSTDEFQEIEISSRLAINQIEEYKEGFERKTRLEQLGLVVGQVSHDLKAPFNEAENFLKSLPALIKSLSDEELQICIDSLLKRVQGGKESLNQAMQFTKQVTVAREEFPLSEIFSSVSARTKENKKLENISIGFSGGLLFRTLGDRLKLETAVLNLLENTADEKQNANVQIEISSSDLGYAKILYSDDGGGIPHEYLDKIFEPLVTFKKTGTGFGLSSTKEIIAQHGGRIRALPHTGGARFEILLPIIGGANA